MRVLGQYVKDLSFENPGHPPVQTQPNIDLGIDVGATPHADGNGLYEVSLKLSAKATADQTVLFISELDYAGLFQLQNVAEDQLEPMLLIECPRLLFPFARRIIAEITREGGFPPLLIDPVDFVQLYQAQYRRAAAATSAGTDTPQ
ncbi:protein-export protein SecB [Hyphomonas johnsonii MHS-2]|jgi:preprotein translocase subunit SecB|uniref:Protein-export protein SecB n=2 Tax=Hyphomonas johnsonii TaxID=81031 RepID=A0A059FML8_9PROT|nr:protein-export protein SecB [Hyphomonas johnsonii MHS-2]